MRCSRGKHNSVAVRPYIGEDTASLIIARVNVRHRLSRGKRGQPQTVLTAHWKAPGQKAGGFYNPKSCIINKLMHGFDSKILSIQVNFPCQSVDNMDMPTPAVYKKMAANLGGRKIALWRWVFIGLGCCLVSIIWAYSPTRLTSIDPFLRLALIVTGASAGALLALVSFTLICVHYWFGNSPVDPDTKKGKTLWPRLGDFAFGFSDWYACVALFCLLIACLGLATGLVSYGLVPIITTAI